MVKTQADMVARGELKPEECGGNYCPHCGEPTWAYCERAGGDEFDCPQCGHSYSRSEAIWKRN